MITNKTFSIRLTTTMDGHATPQAAVRALLSDLAHGYTYAFDVAEAEPGCEADFTDEYETVYSDGLGE